MCLLVQAALTGIKCLATTQCEIQCNKVAANIRKYKTVEDSYSQINIAPNKS